MTDYATNAAKEIATVILDDAGAGIRGLSKEAIDMIAAILSRHRSAREREQRNQLIRDIAHTACDPDHVMSMDEAPAQYGHDEANAWLAGYTQSSSDTRQTILGWIEPPEAALAGRKEQECSNISQSESSVSQPLEQPYVKSGEQITKESNSPPTDAGECDMPVTGGEMLEACLPSSPTKEADLAAREIRSHIREFGANAGMSAHSLGVITDIISRHRSARERELEKALNDIATPDTSGFSILKNAGERCLVADWSFLQWRMDRAEAALAGRKEQP